ncbi:MAG TPA: RIP metalloprotease RseP [Bacteroidia bacterium]|nr:RIP metalloprotease RseP [Bacteroidia bacterium]
MIKVVLFFLSLSILIVLHEFGHFITARLFKMRVKKFYLFFDFLFPLSNVFNFALFKKKVGNTEYGIGWFPFGGYVDIHGMQAEENADPNEKPAHDEFRAKKPWQRLIVLAGGISVNYLLAIVIFSMLVWKNGIEHLPAANAKYGVYCDSVLLDHGMQHGDRIVSIDGKPLEYLDLASKQILLDASTTIEVERNGQMKTITLPAKFAEGVIDKDVKMLMIERVPFVVDSIPDNSVAAKAGMMKGDSIVAVGNDSTSAYYQECAAVFAQNINKKVSVVVMRKGQLVPLSLPIDKDGKIGVYAKTPNKFLKYQTEEFGFFASWGEGFLVTWDKMKSYVKQLKFLFTKAGARKISGFAGIANLFPSEWDWTAFWSLTAFISVVLAFMNLLPIPALDGGYILFVLWEMVTGKKVSDKFMNRALSIGMYIILGLLIYANGNDILRAFKH